MNCGCNELDEDTYRQKTGDLMPTRLILWEPLLQPRDTPYMIWPLTEAKHAVGYIDGYDLQMPKELSYYRAKIRGIDSFGLQIHYCAKTLLWVAHFPREQQPSSGNTPCCHIGQVKKRASAQHTSVRTILHGKPFLICGTCQNFIDDSEHDHFTDRQQSAVRPATERLPLRFVLLFPSQVDSTPEWFLKAKPALPPELQEKIMLHARGKALQDLFQTSAEAPKENSTRPLAAQPESFDSSLNQWDLARQLHMLDWSATRSARISARVPTCIYSLHDEVSSRILNTWNGLMTSPNITELQLNGLDGIRAEDFLFAYEHSGHRFDSELRYRVRELTPGLEKLTINMETNHYYYRSQDWRFIASSASPRLVCQCPLKETHPRNCHGHLCQTQVPQIFELPGAVQEVRFQSEDEPGCDCVKLSRGNIFKMFPGMSTLTLETNLDSEFWGACWWKPNVPYHYVTPLSLIEILTIQGLQHLTCRPAQPAPWEEDGACEAPPFFQMQPLETLRISHAGRLFEDHFLLPYPDYEDLLEQHNYTREEINADELDDRRNWNLPSLHSMTITEAMASPVWNVAATWQQLVQRAPQLRTLHVETAGPLDEATLREDLPQIILRAYGRDDLQIMINVS